MRKTWLACLVLLLSAAWMVAQSTDASQAGSSQAGTSSAGSSQAGSAQAGSSQTGTSSADTNAASSQGTSSGQSTSGGNESPIEGCLSGSGGNFTLTDKSGKSYQLQGDTSKLSDHVGQEVRVKGMQSGASASATSPSGESATASTSG